MSKRMVNDFTGDYHGFSVQENPQQKRLYEIKLNPQVLSAFFQKVENVDSQQLEYVPYMRHIVANEVVEHFDTAIVDIVRGILQDRNTGGFTIGVDHATQSTEDFVKFATGLTHLIGTPNFDSMTGTYYARFSVKDTDNSDSYLRQAYRLFTLHTDGTFVDEPTDWLLMMKMIEENATGGESRLLHLDDWEELDKYRNHSLASYKFMYKAPASKNVSKTVLRTTFYEKNNAPCICFIDQFVYPDTIDQAKYLKELSDSLENSPAAFALQLPVGHLVMLNNHFWMHGRAAFEKHPGLHRELMRQRGEFAQN